MDDIWSESASWVQAIGTIAAVVGAGWVAAKDSRAARQREDAGRRDALERETRALQAAKTAALNLAILAVSQIHDLQLLLKDETRRGRVTHVSPSRTLVSTERQLTAFPIQSLGDAESMVAFSYFPGALAVAEEIYGNLETAVRAAPDDQHVEIFAEYARQMSRLERAAKTRLDELRRALNLPAGDASPSLKPGGSDG